MQLLTEVNERSLRQKSISNPEQDTKRTSNWIHNNMSIPYPNAPSKGCPFQIQNKLYF